MNSPIQFALPFRHRSAAAAPSDCRCRWACLLLGLAVLLLSAASARPQDTPLSVVGRIEGNDISVQGPSTPGNDNETRTPSIMVGNGSVVTVHAGDARLTLVSGGEVDICGPAKFTLLQSGAAITLALDFGRVRVQLPASVSLRLFTPTIVATPIDISGGTRDITVGLDLDDSLCVLAASGALQIEHQFSGEKLIVPEAGEFFLNAGKLLPVVGKPGSCQCAAMQTRPRPSFSEPQEYAKMVQPLTAPAVTSEPIAPSIAATNTPPPAPETPPNVEFSIPAHANEEHPLTPPQREPTPAAPAATMPVYTVVAPLSFTAGTPLPPPDDPPIDMVLLVRETQVQPTWEFQGHVDAPNFAAAMQHALGESGNPDKPPAEPQKKHHGFWGILHRIFGGKDAQD